MCWQCLFYLLFRMYLSSFWNIFIENKNANSNCLMCYSTRTDWRLLSYFNQLCGYMIINKPEVRYVCPKSAQCHELALQSCCVWEKRFTLSSLSLLKHSSNINVTSIVRVYSVVINWKMQNILMPCKGWHHKQRRTSNVRTALLWRLCTTICEE